MIALLDTNAFLYAVNSPERLSDTARAFVSDAGNRLMLSVASGWEIAIKAAQRKLNLDEPPARFIAKHTRIAQIEVLPVVMAHAVKVYELPRIHKDPFDRMLIAQAMVERLPLISSDTTLARYKVKVIW
jgi:PIN domain nuclease of toxin-antitoxin system